MRITAIIIAVTIFCGCSSPQIIPEYTEDTLHVGKYTLQVPHSGWDTDTNLPTFWVYPCSRTMLETVPQPNSSLRQETWIELPNGALRASFSRSNMCEREEVYIWDDGTNVYLSLESFDPAQFVIVTDTHGVSRLKSLNKEGNAEPEN